MTDIVERLRTLQHFDVCYPVPHPTCEEAAARIEQLEADQRDTTEEFGKLSHDLGKALLEATRLREANELMLTDIRRTDVDMLAFKDRIEQLEAALRELDGCSAQAHVRRIARAALGEDRA